MGNVTGSEHMIDACHQYCIAARGNTAQFQPCSAG
jgi:hypothetical protein